IKFRNIQSLLKENLEKSLLLEKSKTIINLEELQAFIVQAKESNDGFVVKFSSYFPDFIVKLTNIAPTLIATEIEVCAMLKLNFTTKEIAASTNSTVLAINRKKNRVRNKLNIPSEINLNAWFIDF
ncbi:helix-turn-helix transcriptional regulator, partial [Chryseobacterium sp. HMWF001]